MLIIQYYFRTTVWHKSSLLTLLTTFWILQITIFIKLIWRLHKLWSLALRFFFQLLLYRKSKTQVNCLYSHVSFPISFEVVIRRLPPSLTEEQLKEELGGLPEHDFFYFVGSDMRYIEVLFPFVLFHFICLILPAEYRQSWIPKTRQIILVQIFVGYN